jgi:hypothetical protein
MKAVALHHTIAGVIVQLIVVEVIVENKIVVWLMCVGLDCSLLLYHMQDKSCCSSVTAISCIAYVIRFAVALQSENASARVPVWVP